MSVGKANLVAILSPSIPTEISNMLLDEYTHIKQQFLLRKFQPSELNGARFCECVLRLLEHQHSGTYTPFSSSLPSSDALIRTIEGNTKLPDTLRMLVPRLVRVILDVRNKRDVAHVGGEVNPNYSDSLLVMHATDWILTEIIRHFHSCHIDEAQRIVNTVNDVRIPVVTEVNGFVRVQNTDLDTKNKVLVVLYYKRPLQVVDTDLRKWLKYGNASRFRGDILRRLDDEALIHYENGKCLLLDKGVLYVEKNIPLELIV